MSIFTTSLKRWGACDTGVEFQDQVLTPIVSICKCHKPGQRVAGSHLRGPGKLALGPSPGFLNSMSLLFPLSPSLFSMLTAETQVTSTVSSGKCDGFSSHHCAGPSPCHRNHYHSPLICLPDSGGIHSACITTR